MRHHSRRRSILVKVSFLVDVMCPRRNYLMASANYAHLQEGKREGKKPINVNQEKELISAFCLNQMKDYCAVKAFH